MKIAFVVHDYSRHGGHARYVAELASRFKNDHEVHVFASVWEEPDPDKIHFHYVPSLRWTSLLGALTFIIPATFMVGSSFDIIHAQGLAGLRHNVCTAHFIQKKWISSLREKGIRTGLSGFLWNHICAPLESFALGYKCSKKVIAISKSVLRDLKTVYKREHDVDLIYHGVDLERFNPANRIKWRKLIRDQYQIPDSSFVLLYVGNLQKGAAAAITAVSNVDGVHLILVSGSKSSRERELIDKLGIWQRVHWVPQSREVEKYFACSDCFVFPTLYEPFGMVISEAMASGIPVITARDAGASELVIHGQTGWLTNDPWDIQEISKGIQFFKSNTDKANAYGLKARKDIESYTWDRCASETMRVYLDLLRERDENH